MQRMLLVAVLQPGGPGGLEGQQQQVLPRLRGSVQLMWLLEALICANSEGFSEPRFSPPGRGWRPAAGAAAAAAAADTCCQHCHPELVIQLLAVEGAAAAAGGGRGVARDHQGAGSSSSSSTGGSSSSSSRRGQGRSGGKRTC